MKKYRNWEEEQLLYLLENYGKLPIDKISKKINKPIGSLYYILKKENIDIEINWWTKEETKLLKKLYPDNSNKELEYIMSRTSDAIQLKAAALNLKKSSWWSSADVERLKDMVFERLSHAKMAKNLNRSRSAIHNKLIEQKLTDECRRWTGKELTKLKQLALSGDYTFLELAVEMNATPGQVYGACRHNDWERKVKRTISYGNDKMISLLSELFPNYTLVPEYHIGERLRLDAYLKQLDIGFEYDGIQHFRYTPQWHRTKQEFERSKDRDRRKEVLCKQQGITLIRIKYNENMTKELLQERIKTEITTPQNNIIVRRQKEQYKRPIPSRPLQGPDKYDWPTRKIASRPFKKREQ
jgi:predicted transcriptional regulator